MSTFREENKASEKAIRYTLYGCYGILAIFGLIGILNLINTMINSVHVRKKELGMLQAIGMSGRQTVYMLQLEGLFYTAGTLAVSRAWEHPWVRSVPVGERRRHHGHPGVPLSGCACGLPDGDRAGGADTDHLFCEYKL